MTISSMTGFARASGTLGALHWQWEAKSVNGKALDVRCRLPTGFEALEIAVRAAVARDVKRGSLQVSLSVSGLAEAEAVVLNETVLDQIVAAGEKLRSRIGGEALRADVLLSMRGVLDVSRPEEDEAALEARNAAMLKSFDAALKALVASRRDEGARLARLLAEQLARIEALAHAARDNPSRSVEAIKQRLADQVAKLLETGAAFDRDRLHQEAVLIATRADIQEELDRLFTHVDAAQGAAEIRRGHRPQVRLPRPGVQPRGQHAVFQGHRQILDGDRPRSQNRHRPDARAGAEH